MTGVSLATQIQFIQNMVLGSITGGVSVLGAQYWGKQDRKTINDIFCMSLRLAGISSFLFFAACMFIPEVLMRIFTNDSALIAVGAGYLRIAGWSYLLTGISQCYQALMKVTEHVPQVALISTVTVLLNIGFNAVFIFGLFGIPRMGAEGAAIATLLARAIELLWSVALSFGRGYMHVDYRGILRWIPALQKDFAGVALPVLGAALLWGVGFTSYTAFVGHLGADAAAANSVAAVIRDLVCCICNGMATAGEIMIGNELGAGRLERGRLYGKRLAKLSFVIGFASTAVILLLTKPVADFMILTDTAREYLVGMMVIMAFYMIGRCVNTITINGVFYAGGDIAFDMYSLAVCMWGIAVPLACLGTFVFHWPVLLVYSCTCLDEVGKIPWVMWHFRKYKWVRNLTR